VRQNILLMNEILCVNLKKNKEDEETLLIGNQARLNIFQWEIASEMKYLQTDKSERFCSFPVFQLFTL